MTDDAILKGELELPPFEPFEAELTDWESAAIGDIAGTRVLDLTGDGGETALALAARGAAVVRPGMANLDPIPLFEFADTNDLDLDLVDGDLADLPDEFREPPFDLVYSGPMTIEWVQNLHDWCVDIADTLRPGGRLVMYDEHPDARILALETDAGYVEEQEEESGASEVSDEMDLGDFIPDIPEWSLDDLKNALAQAGFRIERIEPLSGPQRFFGALDELDPEQWPEFRDTPRAFGLIARKPE